MVNLKEFWVILTGNKWLLKDHALITHLYNGMCIDYKHLEYQVQQCIDSAKKNDENTEKLREKLKVVSEAFDSGFNKMVKNKNAEIGRLNAVVAVKNKEISKLENVISSYHSQVQNHLLHIEEIENDNIEMRDKLKAFEEAQLKRRKQNAEFMAKKRAENPKYGRSKKK